MKISCLFIVLSLSIGTTGCRGLNRLIEGEDVAQIPTPSIISGKPQLGDAPIFKIPQPVNTTKIVYYDFMPTNCKVIVAADSNSTVDVMIKDFSGFWFKLNTTNSSGYVYSFDAVSGIIEYKSFNPQLDLSLMKIYCVYQYVPVVQP